MVKKSALVTVTPEEAGFSKERLARIRPAMQKYIDQEILVTVTKVLQTAAGRMIFARPETNNH